MTGDNECASVPMPEARPEKRIKLARSYTHENQNESCRKGKKQMRHNFARAITFAFIFSAPAAVAQNTLYTDKYGNTTGSIGNKSVSTYTDRSGNTSGTVGNKNVDMYSDRSGNTTGTIGNNRVTTYSDRYGNTTGSIGNSSVNLYTDRSGNTTGTIGGRNVSCYRDSFGNTTCN
jgi:hypothetical protein